MIHYRLRTLLIVLAIGPPMLEGVWFTALAWSKYPAGAIGASILTFALVLSLWRAFGPEPKS